MFVSGNKRGARSQHLAPTLFNMSPRFPVFQPRCMGLRYSIFRANNVQWSFVISDGSDIILGKLGVPVTLSEFSRWCTPSLLIHINRVVVRGARPKMGRITTWWIVARMADIQSLRYGAFSKRVSEPTRSVSLVIVCQNSVSSRISCSNPRPAFIWFFDINHLPKSDLNWFIQPNAVSRAKPFALRFWWNFFATRFANA